MVNRFAFFVALSVFILIVAGALVTTTGSGLSVPDWPLSFGQVFPPMEGGVRFEHSHRLIAATVAFLTLFLTVQLALKEPRAWVKKLGFAAMGAVLLQAMLGGITVLYGLPLQVSAAHAVLGQTFFCLCSTLAIVTTPQWLRPREIVAGRGFFQFGVFAFLTVYTQLILGAILRHGGGRPFLMMHLFNAVIVLAAVTVFYVWGKKKFSSCPEVLFWLRCMFGALHMQILLGVSVLLPMLGKAFFLLGTPRMGLVTAHVAVGAFLLVSTLTATLHAYRRTA